MAIPCTQRTKPVCESLAWDKCPTQQSRSKQESNGSKANQKAEPHRECVLCVDSAKP